MKRAGCAQHARCRFLGSHKEGGAGYGLGWMPSGKHLGGAGRGSGSSRVVAFPSELVANLYPGQQYCLQGAI